MRKIVLSPSTFLPLHDNNGNRLVGLSKASNKPMRYTYLGGKDTAPELVGMQCDPVRRDDGKCVVNVKLATALVVDESGIHHVVLRRRLRLNEKSEVSQ